MEDECSAPRCRVQPTPLPSVAHLGCPYDISADSAAYIKKFAEENDKKKTNEQEDKPHRLSGYGETGTVVKCSQTNQYFKVGYLEKRESQWIPGADEQV